MKKMYLSLKNGQKDREAVLVYAGCHKKYHRLGDFNNRIYILMVLDATSSRSRCQLFQFLVRGFFSGL